MPGPCGVFLRQRRRSHPRWQSCESSALSPVRPAAGQMRGGRALTARRTRQCNIGHRGCGPSCSQDLRVLVKDQHQIGNALHQHLPPRRHSPCPAAGVTSAAGRAVMNGSSRKICFCQPDAPPDRTLAKKGRTASKSSLSASAGSSSYKSVCRLTSASRSGAGPSNGTLCIKAWMAVPRSAPVMPVFLQRTRGAPALRAAPRGPRR